MVGSVLRVRYELTSLISEGPIFAAYEARDRLQARDVCVRVIRQPFCAQREFVTKLEEVVEKYAGIQHPGVESMLEVDEDDATPFLISDLTKGTLLAERIRKLAPFSVPVAVSIAISLCEGLDAIHLVGLSHGDVSAQTIMALPDGQVRLQLPGMWQVYATDPAAASIVLPSMSPYLAPEISEGALPSPAGDVYACGVLLYELLTGRLPYNAETPVSMALKHATSATPSVRMYNPSVPAVLDEIIKRALSKEPGGRYPTAGALLSDLRVLQDALRFGRTVSWPISPAPEPAVTTPMPKQTATRRPAPKNEPKPKRAREPSDVPLFLWILIAIFGAASATILGVWFFFNWSKPAQVKVPSLVGLTVSQARAKVRAEKLNVVESGRKASETIPEDRIVSSDPDTDELVREGSQIRVVLSSGSNLELVPDLRGDTLNEARSVLQASHLELDDNVATKPSSDVPAGSIISQSPEAGKRALQSSRVKVTVSTGDNGSEDGGSKGSGGTNFYTLRVNPAGLKQAVTLRIDVVDDNGTRTVYEREIDPDEPLELTIPGVGEQVTFRVYYDNQLVKEVTQHSSDGTPTPPGDGIQ